MNIIAAMYSNKGTPKMILLAFPSRPISTVSEIRTPTIATLSNTDRTATSPYRERAVAMGSLYLNINLPQLGSTGPRQILCTQVVLSKDLYFERGRSVGNGSGVAFGLVTSFLKRNKLRIYDNYSSNTAIFA